MPCFSPVVYRRKRGGGVTFNPGQAWSDLQSVRLPCGGCIGCRMDRAKEWSTRLVHEAELHEQSSFLTLTFSDENVPPLGSLRKRDVQLFNKRLRKARGPFRFYAVGEYGEENNRPHYHILCFGHDFSHDRYLWDRSPAGDLLYRSPQLEKLWPFGHALIGAVTQQSANYCARYVMKKITGKMAAEHYQVIDPETGELLGYRVPEFSLMSTGGPGGLGAGWFEQFQSDCFPSDFVVIDGQQRPIPRYYKKKLAAQNTGPLPTVLELDLSTRRHAHARKHASDNTPERLATRHEAQILRAKHLKREL